MHHQPPRWCTPNDAVVQTCCHAPCTAAHPCCPTASPPCCLASVLPCRRDHLLDKAAMFLAKAFTVFKHKLVRACVCPAG